MTVISYILAVVETASLIGALVYFTRAMHENKLKRKTKGKKGARSGEQIDRTIASYKRAAGIFQFVYLVLNLFRNFGGFLK